MKDTPPAEVKPPPIGKPAAEKSFFDEIDELAATKPKPPAPKKEGKEVPPPKEPAKGAEKPSESDTKATTQDDSSAATAGAKDTDKPPVKAAELRAAYENLKKEHAALKAEREKEKAAKPAEDPEKKTLLESLDATKKRVAELEEKLKFTNFQESEEYKVKYHQPFIDAYTMGRNRAASLKVTDSEGNERPGTAADFDAIMQAPTDEAAATLAAEMFGTKAPMVLYHRERVQEISAAAAKAQEDFKKGAEQRTKEEVEKNARSKADAEKAAAERNKFFWEQAKAGIEANPEIFKVEEGDTETADLLRKSTATVDLGMNLLTPDRIDELSDQVKSKLVNGKLPPHELTRLHAAIHTRAIGYPILGKKLKAARAKIAELETALAEYQKSEPGADNGKHAQEKRPMTAFEEIDALAR